MEISSSAFRGMISSPVSWRPFPFRKNRGSSEKRESLISLETRFPEIYNELVRIAEFLVYEKGFNHQEIEFTFENATKKGLYILQTRDMVQRETGKVRTFVGDGELERSFLGMGIGVSGGALTGRAVYSEEGDRTFQGKRTGNRPDSDPSRYGSRRCRHYSEGRRHSDRERRRHLPCGGHDSSAEQSRRRGLQQASRL